MPHILFHYVIIRYLLNFLIILNLNLSFSAIFFTPFLLKDNAIKTRLLTSFNINLKGISNILKTKPKIFFKILIIKYSKFITYLLSVLKYRKAPVKTPINIKNLISPLLNLRHIANINTVTTSQKSISFSTETIILERTNLSDTLKVSKTKAHTIPSIKNTANKTE